MRRFLVRLLRPVLRRMMPGAPIGGGAPSRLWEAASADGAVVPVTQSGPGAGPTILLLHPGAALRRARAALDAGDPDRAIAIHTRDIVGSPAALVMLMRFVPPIRNTMRRFASSQIADDEAIESLGVGLDRYAALDLPVLLLGGERSPAHLRARLDALP